MPAIVYGTERHPLMLNPKEHSLVVATGSHGKSETLKNAVLDLYHRIPVSSRIVVMNGRPGEWERLSDQIPSENFEVISRRIDSNILVPQGNARVDGWFQFLAENFVDNYFAQPEEKKELYGSMLYEAFLDAYEKDKERPRWDDVIRYIQSEKQRMSDRDYQRLKDRIMTTSFFDADPKVSAMPLRNHKRFLVVTVPRGTPSEESRFGLSALLYGLYVEQAISTSPLYVVMDGTSESHLPIVNRAVDMVFDRAKARDMYLVATAQSFGNLPRIRVRQFGKVYAGRITQFDDRRLRRRSKRDEIVANGLKTLRHGEYLELKNA